MRPTPSWSDLAGLRVGLYGLGREGMSNLRACRARGIDPVLVDDAPDGIDALVGAVLATARGGADALLECDVVIKSPGISRYSEVVTRLLDAGVTVTGGLALWLAEADPSKVVCVTGTKGKSTTSAIAAHLLTAFGYRCFVGGNLGAPPQDPEVGDGYDYWVIEVSSYQAADVTRSPAVVGLTSLAPDHLPWHASDPAVYYRDKLSLCGRPGAEVTVANGDSELIRAHRDLLAPRVTWVVADDSESEAWIAALALPGEHNRRNARIARQLLVELGVPEASDDAAVLLAAEGFVGLENRLQTVVSSGGVDFVDDGLSTNVLSTVAAVAAFAGRRVALIVGGESRGIDYAELGVGLAPFADHLLVVTIPDNGPEIRAALLAGGVVPETAEAADLEGAVRAAFEWAAPEGVVLLSPAAPSFGRYRDYRHKGAAFTAAAQALVAAPDTV